VGRVVQVRPDGVVGSPPGILIRDTTDRGGVTLTVTAQAWRDPLTRLH
jgi:hypothetical protein